MATLRVPQIESFMPAIDARNTSKVFVLDGRNFYFDSKGPRSGFAARPLTPFSTPNARDVHGRRVRGRTFVFTDEAILAWRTTVPYTWDYLTVFDTTVPESQRLPWSCIYLNGYFYFAHPHRGTFSAEAVDATLRLWLTAETSATIPGLIDGIKAMDVVRSRAILVNDTTIQWSNTSDLTDLTPALGGAGFQLISNFVKGDFLALTSFQDGFVVWTTDGSVLAEFTGDDAVWRFSVYESKEAPIGPWATQSLVNGGTVFLSRRGLMVTNATSAPQDWTADFNEFFREYLANDFELNRSYRLDYDADTQTVFVSESLGNDTYFQAFVLKPTLNKWGMFSDAHYGWLPLTEKKFGYFDSNGVPQVWTPQRYNRRIDPDNSRGLVRLYPRLEKQLDVPSSSAVSRDVTPNLAVPYTVFDPPSAAWYDPASPTSPQSYGLGPMDSWIEVGYLRPDDVGDAIDALLEFHEISIGSVESAAHIPSDFTTDWNADEFYDTIEDWNMSVTLTPGNITEDWNTLSGYEDYAAQPNQNHEDWQAMNSYTVAYGGYTSEDWLVLTGDEDWDSPISGLPFIDYTIRLYSSEDGITFVERTPELAKFNTAKRMFSVDAIGTFHRLRIEATQVGQYYHLTYLGGTMTYAGRII